MLHFCREFRDFGACLPDIAALAGILSLWTHFQWVSALMRWGRKVGPFWRLASRFFPFRRSEIARLIAPVGFDAKLMVLAHEPLRAPPRNQPERSPLGNRPGRVARDLARSRRSVTGKECGTKRSRLPLRRRADGDPVVALPRLRPRCRGVASCCGSSRRDPGGSARGAR